MYTQYAGDTQSVISPTNIVKCTGKPPLHHGDMVQMDLRERKAHNIIYIYGEAHGYTEKREHCTISYTNHLT